MAEPPYDVFRLMPDAGTGAEGIDRGKMLGYWDWPDRIGLLTTFDSDDGVERVVRKTWSHCKRVSKRPEQAAAALRALEDLLIRQIREAESETEFLLEIRRTGDDRESSGGLDSRALAGSYLTRMAKYRSLLFVELVTLHRYVRSYLLTFEAPDLEESDVEAASHAVNHVKRIDLGWALKAREGRGEGPFTVQSDFKSFAVGVIGGSENNVPNILGDLWVPGRGKGKPASEETVRMQRDLIEYAEGSGSLGPF